jgi:hypothetical protein
LRDHVYKSPNWSEATADAASGDPAKMHSAARVAREALVVHLIRLGFPKPSPYEFRYTALKLATAGYVPGADLSDYNQAVHYLRRATHGSKGLDLAKGRIAVAIVQRLCNTLVPCVETSNHLYSTPQTREILTEALNVTDATDSKTLVLRLNDAINQLKYLQERTGTTNNWLAAEKAARERLISGALAMQVFFAAEDRNCIQHPEEAKGWGPVANNDIVSGIRAIGALFGLVPEFLRLPNGGWKVRTTPSETTKRPVESCPSDWIRSELGERRQKALLCALQDAIDDICNALNDIGVTHRDDGLLGLIERANEAYDLQSQEYVEDALCAAKHEFELRQGWIPTIQEALTIGEQISNFLRMLARTIEGPDREDEDWNGGLSDYEIPKTLYRMG